VEERFQYDLLHLKYLIDEFTTSYAVVRVSASFLPLL
jgi:hypothetical protein